MDSELTDEQLDADEAELHFDDSEGQHSNVHSLMLEHPEQLDGRLHSEKEEQLEGRLQHMSTLLHSLGTLQADTLEQELHSQHPFPSLSPTSRTQFFQSWNALYCSNVKSWFLNNSNAAL